MKSWIWPKVGANPISQNTDSEMFDRADYPFTETFVREAIQNTLDAVLDESQPAVISFRFHQQGTASVMPFLKGAIDLRGHAGLTVPPEWTDGSATWLTIEDSNTHGLDGQLNDRLGNFWNYWLNFGISNKTGHGRGGRGIGRVTFLIASRIQAVLGITRRHDDGATAGSGMVLLRAMRGPDNILRSTHAYLAADEDAENSVFRLHSDPAFHQALISAFNLAGYEKEPDRTGLALVIPYPYPELTPDGILASAIEHFGPAILAGALVVRAGDQVLNASSIDEVSDRIAPLIRSEWIKEDIARYLRLLRAAMTATPIIVRADPKEKLGERRDSAEAQKIQQRLETGEPVVCEIQFPLTRKAETRMVSLRALAARTPDGRRPADRLYREGMSLPDVRSGIPGETDMIILVDDDALATYLNFCEGKAHLDLLGSKEIRAKLEQMGYRPPLDVRRFVKSLPNELRAFLTPDAAEPELDVFDSFFSLPDDQPGKRKAAGGKPDIAPPPPPPPPQPRIPAVRVRTLQDGFRLEANPEFTGWPVRVDITMAYADGSKKPAWSEFDFTSKDLSTQANDCDYVFRENKITAKNCGGDFSIEVTGFDVRREVDTRFKVMKHAQDN